MSISSVSGKLSISYGVSPIVAIENQVSQRLNLGVSKDVALASGSVVGEIDCFAYVSASSIAASTTVNYDLRAITDSSGLTGEQEFASIQAIIVKNTRTTALAWLKFGPKDGTNGALILGLPTANRGLFNAGTDRVVIPPGGVVALYSGEIIPTSATFKDVLITTSAVVGDTNSWEMLILGISA